MVNFPFGKLQQPPIFAAVSGLAKNGINRFHGFVR